MSVARNARSELLPRPGIHVAGKGRGATKAEDQAAGLLRFDGLRDESRRIVQEALVEAARQPERVNTSGQWRAADENGAESNLRANFHSVRPDDKDKRRYMLAPDQAGLGLPDRDDYFRQDARTLDLRKAYATCRSRFARAFSCAADAPVMRAPAEQISIW